MVFNTNKIIRFFNCPGASSFDDLIEAKKFIEEYIRLRNIYREGVGYDDVVEAKKFIDEYVRLRNIYRECTWCDPMWETLESNLDKINYYISKNQ